MPQTDALAPLLLTFFVILAIGYGLRATGKVSPSVTPTLDTLVLDVTMPALALFALQGQTLHPQMALAVLATWVALAVCMAAGLGFARLMRASRATQGSAAICAGFSNTGFVGLPVILQLLHGARDSAATAVMIDIFNTTLFLYSLAIGWSMRFGANPAGVSGINSRNTMSTLIRVITTPTFIAVALGLTLSAMHRSLPPIALATCDTLGRATVPLVLLSLGLKLDFRALRGRAAMALGVAAIKLGLCPLVAAGCVVAFHLHGATAQTTILQSAMPCAMMSSVIPARYGCDGDLASGSVALTTVLCVITLPLALLLAHAVS